MHNSGASRRESAEQCLVVIACDKREAFAQGSASDEAVVQQGWLSACDTHHLTIDPTDVCTEHEWVACVEGRMETLMSSEEKPYPVLIIGAFVGFAIILMVWALAGTNGPSSLDATKKPSQATENASKETTGSATKEPPVPAPTAPRNDTVGDSWRGPVPPVNRDH
jgi:hypothetical protein